MTLVMCFGVCQVMIRELDYVGHHPFHFLITSSILHAVLTFL